MRITQLKTFGLRWNVYSRFCLISSQLIKLDKLKEFSLKINSVNETNHVWWGYVHFIKSFFQITDFTDTSLASYSKNQKKIIYIVPFHKYIHWLSVVFIKQMFYYDLWIIFRVEFFLQLKVLFLHLVKARIEVFIIHHHHSHFSLYKNVYTGLFVTMAHYFFNGTLYDTRFSKHDDITNRVSMFKISLRSIKHYVRSLEWRIVK